jgi:elongator complex protein 3
VSKAYSEGQNVNEEVACREIIENLMKTPRPIERDVTIHKMRVAGRHKLPKIPSNQQLLASLRANERRKLLPLLRRKTTRTISGVTVVAVMTEPYPCPQPKPCAYCPGGPRFGVPQSYTGFEPATMRGIQNKYNPYLQVRSRIRQLEAIGHVVDKVELVIMGGTFPATPIEYQEDFIRQCLSGITGKRADSIDEAKRNAETSMIKNVGITVETRPDWAKQEHVNKMLGMGVTRVELGVQNPSDRIYGLVGRKHTVEDVVTATRVMKDAGLKIVYHMMPGLPGSGSKQDLKAFKAIFSDPRFKPDMIKIYPCLVIKGTKAYNMWRKGEYTPYTTEEAAELIVEVKKIIPPCVRIMRVQRDIPANLIIAGVNKSNLREIVAEKLRAQGLRCRCIRCREAGHRMLKDHVKPDPSKIEIRTNKQQANEGEDVFISAEDMRNDVLVGYLRLRIPSVKAHREEIIGEPCAIVRELHVYGIMVPVGRHFARAWQHKGYGNILLSEGERMTYEEYGRRKVVVISALGTKQYYMRTGYSYDGPYVSKWLGL